MKRSHAILALLVVGVLMVAGVAAYAAPPAQSTTTPTPTPPTPTPAIQEDAAAYLTLNLEAGFPLDPFIVSANGGGPVDASTIADNCTGYVNQNPTLSVDWSGSTELIRIFYYSDHDPTLMVRLPNGDYVCNDNANRLLLDPLITLQNPEAGNYRIWVGAADAGQLVPGVLAITARKDVSLGDFSLADLVKRGPIADTLEEPVATNEREAFAAKLLQGVAALKTARNLGALQSFTQDVQVTGELEAHELPIGEEFCNGYISEKPDMVFDAPADGKALFVYFEGDGDSTLVVAQPDGTFLCNDDILMNENVNPMVTILKPMPGQYDVWVGRVTTDAPISGQLTVTSLAKQPAMLAPKPAPTPSN